MILRLGDYLVAGGKRTEEQLSFALRREAGFGGKLR